MNNAPRSPFPGMDPYLEHHALWPDVHNSLIAAIRDTIAPAIAPAYYVRLESRAYVFRPEGNFFLGRPDIAIVAPIGPVTTPVASQMATNGVMVLDVELPIADEIDHYYLEIRSTSHHELITIIEILSPVNKIDKQGRHEYLQKRYNILTSYTNYIEIDLLRDGEPMPLVQQVTSDYRILVSQGWMRRKAHLYAFNLPTAIPTIPLPLQPHDPAPPIPLNQLLHDLYCRARFDLQLDYTRPAVAPLTPAQTTWAEPFLAALR